MSRAQGLAAVLALMCGAMASPAASASPALRCAVQVLAASPEQGSTPSTPAGQPVWIRFTITNPGPRAVQVLRWNTPWEDGWFAPFVALTREGQPLAYRGAMRKRGEPSAAHYLRLAPGASEVAELDLALPFDLSQPGRYALQPALRLVDVFEEGEAASLAGLPAHPPRLRAAHQGQALDCPGLSFRLTGALPARPDRG